MRSYVKREEMLGGSVGKFLLHKLGNQSWSSCNYAKEQVNLSTGRGRGVDANRSLELITSWLRPSGKL